MADSADPDQCLLGAYFQSNLRLEQFIYFFYFFFFFFFFFWSGGGGFSGLDYPNFFEESVSKLKGFWQMFIRLLHFSIEIPVSNKCRR